MRRGDRTKGGVSVDSILVPRRQLAPGEALSHARERRPSYATSPENLVKTASARSERRQRRRPEERRSRRERRNDGHPNRVTPGCLRATRSVIHHRTRAALETYDEALIRLPDARSAAEVASVIRRGRGSTADAPDGGLCTATTSSRRGSRRELADTLVARNANRTTRTARTNRMECRISVTSRTGMLVA